MSGFPVGTEQKRDAPKTGQTDQAEDNAGQKGQLSAEQISHCVKTEQGRMPSPVEPHRLMTRANSNFIKDHCEASFLTQSFMDRLPQRSKEHVWQNPFSKSTENFEIALKGGTGYCIIISRQAALWKVREFMR